VYVFVSDFQTACTLMLSVRWKNSCSNCANRVLRRNSAGGRALVGEVLQKTSENFVPRRVDERIHAEADIRQ